MSSTLSDGHVAPFACRRLSDKFAAEIVGIDLRHTLDAATRQGLLAAFVCHQALCFRDQSLSGDEQIAFTAQFGPLERHTIRNRGTGNPLLNTVSNLGADGKPSGQLANQLWHSDKSFRPAPCSAAILHAVIMPPDGGDTCFADIYAPYDALPEAEKAELEQIRVIHSWELSLAKSGKQATPEEIADAPPMAHLLLRVHPESGRKALFMGEHTSHFEGQPMAVGRARLAALEAHATQKICLSPRMAQRRFTDVGQSQPARADRNFDPGLHPSVLHRTCLRGTPPV